MMPHLQTAKHIHMDEILRATRNTGVGRTDRQSMGRRAAVPFGLLCNTSDKCAALRGQLILLDGHWMNPVAIFRKKPPSDSEPMKALPESKKQILFPLMLTIER
jgi:hypothetical protein